MSDVMNTTAADTRVGPLLTEIGRVWDDRLAVSERKFRRESLDWDALHQLYVATYEQRNRWGTNVSMGWSIIQNIVETSVPALPEPWIMPRSGAINPDVPKMLRDLAKTIHKSCDTKGVMKRARTMAAYSSMPCLWPYFKQVSVAIDENRQPIGADDYETPIAGYAAKQQLVKLDLRSSWDMRYDPDGREWDLSDHKWIGTIYTRMLQDCLDDPDFINKDLLIRHVRNRMGERRGENGSSQYFAGYQEKDYRYMPVELCEIWSRAEHVIVQKPIGARFHAAAYDWPDEWKEADLYPAVPIGINWEGDDRKGTKGFYSVPDLRLIRSQLENLNRLEGLYLDATTHSVKKYFYPDGIFDDKAWTKIQSDTNREFIGINWKLLKSKLGVETGQEFNPAQVDLRSLIMLMPSESREEALKHEEAINHELEMIYEILGQSAADRGGALADARSATQAIQIGQGQQRRMNSQREDMYNLIDHVTERIFILLREHQTLPMQYLTTGDHANQATWQAFLAEDLVEMDLAFYHHAGPAAEIDRDTYRLEIREVITQLLPIIVSGAMTPEVKFLIRELLTTYDIPGVDRAFNDQVPQLVQQGLLMLDAVQTGKADPTNPQIAMQFVEMFSMLLNALATPADVQAVVQATSGGDQNVAKQGGQTQQAPAKKPMTPGQSRAAGAAAGVVGGVN